MNFSVISIFPEMMENFLQHSLISKAIENNIINVDVYNLRDFSKDRHKKVDDRPFGGGAGMVLMPQPLFDAIDTIKRKKPGRVILFSAYAEPLTQKKVKALAEMDHLILVCGRYEGVDQRVIDELVDEEISIGEYVLMGGEVAAEVLIECVSRMKEGVVGKKESVETDSFFVGDQLGFPQYTQPRDFKGFKVPDVLVSGNHKKITEWRKRNQKKHKS